MRWFFSFLLLGAVAAPGWSDPQAFALREGNSSVRFRVGHLLSSAEGSFESSRGKIVMDPMDAQNDSVEWVVNVRSINTGNSSRDQHLLSAEYFNPDKFPTLQFLSHSIQKVDGEHLAVTGQFTLCGVTKTITVPVSIDGSQFDCQFSILRSDYGFTAGSPLVGDQVDIDLHFLAQKSWFPEPK